VISDWIIDAIGNADAAWSGAEIVIVDRPDEVSQRRPKFLKLPITSPLLVSTLMMGSWRL
jgi:hypothetical protein